MHKNIYLTRMIPYKEVQKNLLKIGKYQTLEDRTQIQQLTDYYHQESRTRQGLTRTQITPSQIIQINKKNTSGYNKQNETLFFEILEQAKNLPFWIPDPDKYINFNIEHVVKKIDAASSQEELDAILDELKREEEEKHKDDILYHKKRFHETLTESFEKWEKGELPHKAFIRPRCCFNHFIGLPNKGNKLLPVFDYELFLVSLFGSLKRIDILKSRGLGVTEIVIRYILSKITRNRDWSYRMGCIITGIKLDPAVDFIRRMKRLFEQTFPIVFNTRESEFILNDVVVKAFPSKNSADTLRSYADVAFIIIDEADFFKLSDQVAIKHAAEGYFLKSQPLMIWISTPNAPGGIMENFRHQFLERVNTISNQKINDYQIPLDADLEKLQGEYYFDYFHVELPYHLGLGKIYDKQLLQVERTKDYFPREYLLQFGFGIGDLFSETDIRKCFIHEYNPFEWLQNTQKVLTIDQGMGSSKFAFMVTELVPYPELNYNIKSLAMRNQRFLIRVLYAEEFYRPDPSQMENLTWQLINDYRIVKPKSQSTNTERYINDFGGRIGVDGANIGFIKKVKEMIKEPVDYDKTYESLPLEQRSAFLNNMRCMPINFMKLQKQMLYTAVDYITKGFVAINPFQFNNLLNQMRIAKADDRGLVKEKGGPTLDLLDTLRMNMYIYSMTS